MKILGIGVDIVQNKRIRSLIKNKTFILRTFGKKEVMNPVAPERSVLK